MCNRRAATSHTCTGSLHARARVGMGVCVCVDGAHCGFLRICACQHSRGARVCQTCIGRFWRLRQQLHSERAQTSKGVLYSILDAKRGLRVGADEPEAEVVTIFGSAFLSAVEERASRDL